jgi:class 3 adenylate cyclase/predicted ATPase
MRSAVTFLFTDIEGSTQLYQKFPLAYPRAVTRHHELLGKALAARGGRVFETIGDAVFAVFPQPVDAVLASMDAQRALSEEKWAEVGEIRVRMGVHTDEAELRDGHYFGPAVQRCEKIMSTGYGGQVLVSAATASVVSRQLSDGIGLRDMGTHRLRGLGSTERIFQVTHANLRSQFPPLKSLTTFLAKLPARAGTVVGREVERSEVERRLSSSRLVTVTGSPGIGKTRLAIEIGADLLDQFPDGAWFVAVGGAAPRPVVESIAETLGMALEHVRRDPAALFEALGTKQLLLILDGCDTALGECAVLVQDIIHHSRHVKILATSREVLAITGEVAVRLPALSDADSLALFRERLAASSSGFAVPVEQASLVSQLILLLDGIPTAIEDAARRIATSSLEDVVSRSRTEHWSDSGFVLLPTEQTLVQRVSVLEGAWTIEVAEAVASGEEIHQADVLDLLASLVEKSVLLTQTMDDGSIRYRLPELLRQHGQRALAENGELEELRLRSRQLQAAITREPSA